jgi:hypothetical protein
MTSGVVICKIWIGNVVTGDVNLPISVYYFETHMGGLRKRKQVVTPRAVKQKF